MKPSRILDGQPENMENYDRRNVPIILMGNRIPYVLLEEARFVCEVPSRAH